VAERRQLGSGQQLASLVALSSELYCRVTR
jgi:hypothetical protein